MRTSLLLISLLPALLAAEPNHYRMQVQLNPAAGEVSVTARFAFAVDAGATQVRFALNKGFRVAAASCDECSGYSFFTGQPAGVMYVNNAAPLRFTFKHPLPAKKTIHFRVRYEGKLQPSGENAASADWVELALYSAWYPVAPELGRFTYDLNVTLAPQYKVTGAGNIQAAGAGRYRIRQAADTFDIVLMASPRLHSTTVSPLMRMDSVGLTAEQEAHIASSSQTVMERLTAWFGPSNSTHLTVVFTPREQGGGYSRPGMVCYSRWSLGGDDRLLRGLAHEMGHLWWIGAPVETWEDWLNEGFAEYTSLLIVRDRLGDAAFRKAIADVERNAHGAPAIWGIARGDRQAYTVLYEKGALVLYRLEQQIGREAFARYLQALAQDKTRTVEEALTVLAKTVSPDARASLERMLHE